MPINLKPIDPAGKFRPGSSVLFVACGACPRMCLAAGQKKPYFSISHFLRRPDYFEAFIAAMRARLEKENIRSAVFKTPFLSAMMCLWPLETRERLRRQLSGFDAVAVIGCSSAAATVKGASGSSAAPVVQLSEELGIANFITRVRFPFRMEITGS